MPIDPETHRVTPEAKLDMSGPAVLERINPDEVVREMHEEGGFTVNPRTGDRPETGVFVSVKGHEEKHELESFGKEQVSEYINSPDNLAQLTRTRNLVGGWGEDGEAYLDVSRTFPETGGPGGGFTRSRTFAKLNDQIAFFQRSNWTTEYNPNHPKNIAPGHVLAKGEADRWENSWAPLGTNEPVVERESDNQRGWMFGETVPKKEKPAVDPMDEIAAGNHPFLKPR